MVRLGPPYGLLLGYGVEARCGSQELACGVSVRGGVWMVRGCESVGVVELGKTASPAAAG